MKAQVSHEVVGETGFGDPEVVVTVLEPHPKAGFQLLMRSTASMEHMSTPKGFVDWLVDEFPLEDMASAFGHRWHGTARASSVEDAVEQVREHVDWLWRREQIRDSIDISGLRDHLDRFDRGLYEASAVDYVEEWERVIQEVVRVTFIVREGRGEQVADA